MVREEAAIKGTLTDLRCHKQHHKKGPRKGALLYQRSINLAEIDAYTHQFPRRLDAYSHQTTCGLPGGRGFFGVLTTLLTVTDQSDMTPASVM